MDPCDGGAFRLAAARGDIAAMYALADGSRRFHVDADHEGFTPLHAASVEGRAGMHMACACGRPAQLYICLPFCGCAALLWRGLLTVVCHMPV